MRTGEDLVDLRQLARHLSNRPRRHRYLRTQRRQCRQLVANLEIPAGASLETVCALLGTQRPRTIKLAAITTPEPPWSFTFSTATTDYICYPYRTSSFQQQQHIARQLAHLLLGHLPEPNLAVDDGLGRLLNKLHPQTLQRLGGLGYHAHMPSPEEVEAADYFGFLLLGRLHDPPEPPPAPNDRSQAAAARRLTHVLEGRPR